MGLVFRICLPPVRQVFSPVDPDNHRHPAGKSGFTEAKLYTSVLDGQISR
jgi:hypothetical protein